MQQIDYTLDYPPVLTETYDGDQIELYGLLQGLEGVFLSVSLDPLLPKQWSRSGWEYAAYLAGPDPAKTFQRQFFGSSGSRGVERRTSRGGPLLYRYNPDQLPLGSLVEIRTKAARGADRYQRIFRLDEIGWFWLAYRQEDVAGWHCGRYRFRRFYPWELILKGQ